MTINSATSGSDWFLNGLANLQKQQEKTQREISSGFRVNDAADSPGDTKRLIALGSQLASRQTWQSNLSEVKAEAVAGDDAIGAGVALLEQARAIAVRGSRSTPSSVDRQILAAQVQSLQDQLVSTANTTVEGRYIFGGDQDGAPPYALNSASPTGVSALTAQTATRVITGPDGETVFQSSTAAAIFDRSPNGAFAALQDLRTALLSNNIAGIGAALQSLQGASDWLNQQQGSYGVAEQRINDAQTSVGNEILSIRTGISELRDTDIAQAAVDLARENTSQSAALAAQAQTSRKTLFDYLG